MDRMTSHSVSKECRNVYSRFVSVAVVFFFFLKKKYPHQKQIRGGRGSFQLTDCKWPITKESQGRKSSRNLKQKVRKKAAFWLTPAHA